MTNEQINIAIAKACGWKQISIHMGLATVWVDPSGNKQENFPDYCNDLNAMHEAEESIKDEDQQIAYMTNLSNLCFGSGDQSTDTHWNYIHAPAHKRAKAFLQTLGKWEEGK